jgi:uncharacterized protein YceK
VLAVGLLVATLVLSGCTTIRVTVTGEDGLPLSDIGVHISHEEWLVLALLVVSRTPAIASRGYCDLCPA